MQLSTIRIGSIVAELFIIVKLDESDRDTFAPDDESDDKYPSLLGVGFEISDVRVLFIGGSETSAPFISHGCIDDVEASLQSAHL